MTHQFLKWLLTILFVLWLFFVITSFYIVQKPFDVTFAAALIRLILDGGVFGWLALVALGLGAWGMKAVARIRSLSPASSEGQFDLSFPETLIFSVSLGLGLLGLLSLGLGLLGLFTSLVAYLVTLSLTLVSLPPLRDLFNQFRRWKRKTVLTWPHPLPVIYLGGMAGLMVLLALLPPTDFDGLFYHLTAPKHYIQAGQVVSGVDIPHFNFPALMEMLFAWAMLLRGDVTAKLIHTLYALLLAGLVYQMTGYLFGKKAAVPALLIFASMPLIYTLGGWAYNDLALAFYQLASVYAFIRWRLEIGDWRFDFADHTAESATAEASEIANRKSKIVNPPWLLLSGIFAGLAMGLKYTSFVTPTLITLLIIWSILRTRRSLTPNHHLLLTDYRLLITSVLTFTLSALLIAAPWYLKNWVFTGNPVYPFLHGIFGGIFWDDFRAAWYSAAGTGVLANPVDFATLFNEFRGIVVAETPPGGSVGLSILALPWLLTLGLRDSNFWDGRTGPLLLLLLPAIVGFALSRRHRLPHSLAINTLLFYSLAHYGFWLAGVLWSQSLWQSRLLLPGLVGLVPVAGWAWRQLNGLELPHFSLGRFVNITVGLILTLTIIEASLLTRQINPIPYLIGTESRSDYLTRRLGAYAVTMEKINTQLPPAAKIVFLWEPRSYYCDLDCRPDSILDEFPHLVNQFSSAERIVQHWQAQGITHILVYRSGLDLILAEDASRINQAILAELEDRYLMVEFTLAGAYQLYSLEQQ